MATFLSQILDEVKIIFSYTELTEFADCGSGS